MCDGWVHTCLFLARQKSKGTRDVLWLKTVLSSGTLGDKVAALTLLVQESPVHTLSSLDTLLTMAAKKGKREGILAAGKTSLATCGACALGSTVTMGGAYPLLHNPIVRTYIIDSETKGSGPLEAPWPGNTVTMGGAYPLLHNPIVHTYIIHSETKGSGP